MSETYDLIVIGCGAAGLSTAVAYAEARPDAKIAVLERATRKGRGGATRWTSSWFRITEDRQLDPAFIGKMEEVSGGKADLDYCRMLEAEARATLDFLEGHGVELIFFKQPFANRNTGGGLGMPAQGGAGIVDGLAARFEASEGADILYETEAVRLTQDEQGRVDGVVVRNPDRAEHVLNAPAVVIACGGFEGNKAMLAEHLGARGAELDVIAPTLVNNTGDGLRMATALGADTAGQFDMFHGEPVDTRSSKPDAVVYPYPFGILVNGEAKRFFDEGQDSFDSTFELLGYEIWKNQNQTAFLIADQQFLAIPNVEGINLSDQPPIEADTIAELAEKLGLDPAALEATVAEYNEAVEPGEFDPTIRDGKAAPSLTPPKSNWAQTVEQAPFLAWPLTCAITFTFGGLRSDSRARVVRPDGTPIPGLYAAGEVTGLYYKEYPAGTSVLRSATFGRIAAREIAATAGN
ncbi:FAD-dependent oxidoreductase [Parasphingopyxis marina]|uniref:FAD-dependent oxidoreductase n=1 Tax=Parasphingopyxis marina TaxID=2761622 RepID=A0A842HYQ4_9SPHN|nr:FAD-dependent oxidoreductase [Parasphingopyxis marina]MBC2778062.1 FAD-dependent oxidoreductase [Parasphingopyxis marina]